MRESGPHMAAWRQGCMLPKEENAPTAIPVTRPGFRVQIEYDLHTLPDWRSSFPFSNQILDS